MSKDALKGSWRVAVKRLLKVTGTQLVDVHLQHATMDPGVEAETVEARGQLIRLFEREDEEAEEKIRELQAEREMLKTEREDFDRPFVPRKKDQQLQLPLEGAMADDGATPEAGPLKVYQSDGQGGLVEGEPVAQPIDPTKPPVEFDLPEDINLSTVTTIRELLAAGHSVEETASAVARSVDDVLAVRDCQVPPAAQPEPIEDEDEDPAAGRMQLLASLLNHARTSTTEAKLLKSVTEIANLGYFPGVRGGAVVPALAELRAMEAIVPKGKAKLIAADHDAHLKAEWPAALQRCDCGLWHSSLEEPCQTCAAKQAPCYAGEGGWPGREAICAAIRESLPTGHHTESEIVPAVVRVLGIPQHEVAVQAEFTRMVESQELQRREGHAGWWTREELESLREPAGVSS